MAMHPRAVALWSLLFIIFILCSFGLILTDYTSPGYFVFLGCMLLFVLWYGYGGNTFVFDEERGHSHQEARIENIGSEATQRSVSAETSPIMIERIRAQYSQHLQDVQLVAFLPRARIARLAIRALPPVRAFNGDETSDESHHDDCPICMEEFKDGELIQPFGVCVHQFHSSCLNSWLLGGKTTCPVCRTELSSPQSPPLGI